MPVKDGIWDVIVVGGGPAGVSAAMVLARSRRKVMLIDEGNQRNLKSHGLHNFVTRDGILPPDFLEIAYKELANYPVKVVKGSMVSAGKEGNLFRLKDAKGKEYACKKVLLATGVVDFVPDIPGMKELWGCAIFHCPFCDGYECKEDKIGLYAKKHNGYGMALALRNLSKQVTLYTDGAFYLKSAQRQQLEKRQIKVVTRRISHLVHEGGKLLAVALAKGEEVPCDYMFTHHGHKVHSLLLEQLRCNLTSKGAAITNRQQQTNVPGVYVAGDASIDMHFVVVASAEGVKAAVAIHNDLLAEENREAMKVKDL